MSKHRPLVGDNILKRGYWDADHWSSSSDLSSLKHYTILGACKKMNKIIIGIVYLTDHLSDLTDQPEI